MEPRQPQRDFLNTAAEAVRERAFRAIPDKDGKYHAQQVIANLRNMGKIPEVDWETMKKAGIDAEFPAGKKATVQEIAEWMEANGPTAKKAVYGMEGKVSEAKKEFNKMQHEWYDNLSPGARWSVDTYYATRNARYAGAKNEHNDIVEHIQENYHDVKMSDVEKYALLKDKTKNEPQDTSLRATPYYEIVSALNTKEPMPDWTTSKSSKNVQRVDVAVPPELVEGKTPQEIRSKASSEVLWSQDNLHENLPNTLGWAMIQYKTGPNGEKIAVIAEAQSRWGQEVRQQNKDIEATEQLQGRSIPRGGKGMIQEHPLLKDYNRLILKAAIDQARKEGATHIMVSDSKSAMMSEVVDTAFKGPFDNEAIAKSAAVAQNKMVGEENAWKPYRHGEQWYISDKQGGFDFNYDIALPQSAEELTGSKGERVSLGEHKNAFDTGEEINPETGEATTLDDQSNFGRPRSNLIFKNPDGSPKTDVSGVMYPLKDVPDRAPKLTGRKYQEDTFSDTPAKEEPSTKSKLHLGPLQPEVDRVRSRHGTEGAIAAAGAEKYYSKKDFFGGKLFDKMVQPLKDLELTEDQNIRLRKYLHEMRHSGKSAVRLDDKQRKAADFIKKVMPEVADIATEEGVLIEGSRHIKKTPNYFQDMMAPEFVAAIAKGDKAEKFVKSEYIKHLEANGLSKKEATEAYTEYKAGLGAHGVDSTTANKFGALSKAEGYGLPLSLVDKDVTRSMARYARRAANHIAYASEIQNNPKVAAVLNVKNQAGDYYDVPEGLTQIHDKDDVKQMMRGIHGETDTIAHPNLAATARAVSASIMGTGTAVRNLAVVPTAMSPYLRNVGIADRYALLKNNIGDSMYYWTVYQEKVLSMEYATSMYESIVKYNGEGVMFKDPKAPYVHGLVGTFLKWKPEHTEEAKVIGHIPGKDAFEGTTGSLFCEWNGKLFKMGGMTRETRKNPPAIGSIITFKYSHLTDLGIPKSAQFVCVRNYE